MSRSCSETVTETLSSPWIDLSHGVGSYIGVADFNQDGILDIYISGHVLGPAGSIST